ncbi:phosphopantothenoylcysteine decarboxylase domain-containing protein [Adhaeribacter radiodurans]|uniref:Phosphopantothenoylcysteine decarboxylase n=1 Tax=Adhaeribacter radiodurans TaxID=2745197 RepID=A0A7L7L3Q6_9BACT|nr:phosphopantothenoylcysteine decarboxylase [Adhaeribacter radiodurans]QMU27403.1 phosphopantothenoylcysteine decarboxylase [Adhaeribacter radiodurans]
MPLLKGKTVLLTAGPTQEALDPVRYISNHSTGKMGYALAECLAEEGSTVYLVSGPTALRAQHPLIKTFPVVSAEQMYQQCRQLAEQATIWIFAAAVADYRPKEVSPNKIKKSDGTLTIELIKNVDIAATLGQTKKPTQFSIGFALETDKELENAQAKLVMKNFDLIILNSLNDSGAGFRHDTNKISIIEKDKITKFELKPKNEVARDIVRFISQRIHA